MRYDGVSEPVRVLEYLLRISSFFCYGMTHIWVACRFFTDFFLWRAGYAWR